MSLEADLYELALSQPCINTHCHIDCGEPLPRTLPELFQKSYLNWQFKKLIHPDMDMDAFLERVACNSYFYILAKALGDLYSSEHTPLNRKNWREIQAGLAASAQEPHKLERILIQNCRCRRVILDLQSDPGGDNGLSELFCPAFRCDMFLRGHPGAGRDENGNDPRKYLDVSGELSLSEYLAAMDRSVAQRAGQGAAALKLAIAYERGLDFMPADQRAAERGWSRGDASSAEVKAFEDMAAFHLCRTAGELGIPVQIHTGMGNLVRTRALWLKPLLDGCPHTKFVLLHCSYPHTADTMALLHEYNQVYADLSWLPLLSPRTAAAVLDEALDVADAGRIGWGCDAETLEESLGARDAFCRVLAQVLSGKEGYYSPELCRSLVSQVLLEGPAELYGLRDLEGMGT